MARGSRRRTIGFQPISGPFTRALRALRTRPESRSALYRRADHRESRSALYSCSRKQICKRKLISRKSWTRILADHSRARRAPFAGAQRGEPSERARVLPSSSHSHLQSMESIQLFKLGSLHLHWQGGTNLLSCTYALMDL
jgi:hypothetical protein